MVLLPLSDDFEEGPAVSREVSGTSGSLAVSVFFLLDFNFVRSPESTATLVGRAYCACAMVVGAGVGVVIGVHVVHMHFMMETSKSHS